MKLNRVLTIDDKPQPIIEDHIHLRLNTPGRAFFIVENNNPLTGIVKYNAGWAGQKIRNIFTGFVESAMAVNNNKQLLICRELSATLDKILPLSLRHVTARQVLNTLTQEINIEFRTPDTDYMKKQTPYFYSLSGGYKNMDDIGKVFQIPRYIWQLQTDGTIYAGSWDDAAWTQTTVTLPDNLLKNHAVDNTANIGFMPALRPGIKSNRGVIHSVTIKGTNMEIEWKHLEDW